MSDTAQAKPYRVYWVTWGALLVITLAMLAAEMLHLPRWFLIGFLLCFMMVKALMIGGNFMHLRYEKASLAIMVFAGIMVTSLILLGFITPETWNVMQKTLR
jgi:cytochrome c oxidase subunit IV